MTIAMLVLSILINAALVAIIHSMSTSKYGWISRDAILTYLRILSIFHIPCSIVGYDLRKVNAWNAENNWSATTGVMGRLIQIRKNRGDVVGKFGGDEFVIVSAPHSGSIIAKRIVVRAQEITNELPTELRKRLSDRTGGIVDGLYVAIASCDYTTDAYGTAARLIDETEHLKEHDAPVTGNRATTGNKGTLVCEMK